MPDAMSARHLGPEAELAIEAVAQAVRFARAVAQEAASGALAKPDASPVTIADFGVQALVAARLARGFRDDALVAEEDAAALRGGDAALLRAGVGDLVNLIDPAFDRGRLLDWIDRGGGTPGRRFWTLDPIDGTKGLLRGGQYVIALALIVDGVVQLAVLGCPRLSLRSAAPSRTTIEGGLAVAVRDRGAWWASPIEANFERLSVSATADPGHARVLHSVDARHSDRPAVDRALGALGVEAPPVLMDSQAKHVVVAGGGADLLLRIPTTAGFRDAIWDQAAGAVLIEEAGGRVTDLLGRRLDFSTGRRLTRNYGLVASNGALHDAVLAALREVEAPGCGGDREAW
jgi:3'(2'), 5'-bisphosphate nucleotidase